MLPFVLNLGSNWHHCHVSRTTSTMLRLREADLSGRSEEFVLLTTDYQTAGHGQRGTVWEAEAGRNLIFGFLVHPAAVPATHQFALSEALSLAVAEGLDAYTAGISLKWPNDIYWRDRKICGMLLEHDLRGGCIATTLTGVGVNVNQRTFRSDAPNPVSLAQITGCDISREALLTEILQHFERYYRQLQGGDFHTVHEAYSRRLYRREGFHPYRDAGGAFEAEIVSVSPTGFLTLRRWDGSLRPYAFKEVAFVMGEKEEKERGEN